MLKKIIDYLFPKYTVEWDFIQNGFHYKSLATYRFDSLGAARRQAELLDRAMCTKKLHVVKDKDGKIVD